MKNSIKLVITIVSFVFTSQIVNAQDCTIEQNTVTNGTMGKKTDKAVFIGQSFTACKTGKLTQVSFRIGGGNQITNVELRVFSDKKIAKEALHSQKTELPTPAPPVKNYEDVVVKLDNGGLKVEEGKTYTVGFFKPKTATKEFFRFKSDNTNSFEGGALVANSKVPGGKKQNKDVDMVFSFTIE